MICAGEAGTEMHSSSREDGDGGPTLTEPLPQLMKVY